MKFYNYGRDLYSPEGCSNYVAIPEKIYDKSLQELLELVKQTVQSTMGKEVVNTQDVSFTCSDGSIYTIAHEYEDVSGVLTKVPSTLHGFLSSRLFTIDNVYVNDKQETVDYKRVAENCYYNKKLKINNTLLYKKIITSEPNMVYTFFDLYIQGFSCDDNLREFLHYEQPCKERIKDTSVLESMIEKNGSKFFKFIEHYNYFKNYLFDVCKMRIKITFNEAA